ncbi:Alpha/beta superfamily hydrolase [Ignavibacterium album JCM 16511]|uniref:Alpha/beta superfamily hydrolase n=1 Tax=Ignavibacterium album (strain DSM 19864 / JCM 16511 / NBRC 101810 / Mat9-16) TaxID=945713 RepID=I0AGK7_IGNAJ|nr:alpha/beta hydrolase [Ignavibacterium album]AFH48114.1 Alpha/beta superfamily hydrolase [Ignavibacterium album JCM 16511]
MRMILRFFLILLLSTNLFGQENNLSGSWSGKLKLPNGIQLTVVFNINYLDEKYSATLDSPDQGIKGIPCGEVQVTNDSISIDVPAIVGSYKGKINSVAKTISGIWSQSGSSFELNLEYSKEYTGPNRPQEPKPPFPYNSEDVKFFNEKDSITLAGTFAYPKEGEKFPAVILISGSGAQNRDEEIFNHKPFLVISDFLTKNGFAVLRFDDRGFGESEGSHSLATTYDFAEDVRAAVKYLKSRKEVDKNKIGLIGHSEGAMIASIVASTDNEIAFIILMAGPGLPGDSILYLQTELIYKAEGESEEKIREKLTRLREVYSILKSDYSESEMKEKLKVKYQQQFEKMSDEEKQRFGDLNTYMEMEIRIATSPWFRTFLKFDPRPFLEKIKCPVLAINGEKDLQIPSQKNLPAIEKALKQGGNKNFLVKELPGLNHLFQTSSFGTIGEYGVIEETISPVALDTMLNWLKEILK